MCERRFAAESSAPTWVAASSASVGCGSPFGARSDEPLPLSVDGYAAAGWMFWLSRKRFSGS